TGVQTCASDLFFTQYPFFEKGWHGGPPITIVFSVLLSFLNFIERMSSSRTEVCSCGKFNLSVCAASGSFSTHTATDAPARSAPRSEERRVGNEQAANGGPAG